MSPDSGDGASRAAHQLGRRIDALLGINAPSREPSEAWSDASLANLESMSEEEVAAWRALFEHRQTASAGKPSKKWLGTGNILMEPNDEYLCIVPKPSFGKATDGMFLPFEGDRTMSIILSKALLLAEDTKIKDRTIVSQIKRETS